MKVTWKDIGTVPNANEFLDVVLNRTQRKTPTVIRPGFKISRIRAFYMRKVRYTADGFTEKLQDIVDSFPRLDDIHPFHQDLLNTLYDRDHYKIALSQLSMAKHLIDQVSRDYVRLLKFGQSLFQCKQLKRAAMGRMATIVKRLKDPLLYLEQVRQHLGRLPAIDPNTRTLVICGYPNVGKSSFLKSITRADVDVQPYAFTTKSLYVGHFDYKYLRYQAIDTPGILDHPLEEMNTIEMQSITAIAHLRSCILYFMDLSEQCGFSVEAQVHLYHSIKPLFANKTVMVIINKIDAMRPEDLDENRRAMLDTITAEGNVEIMQLSCHLETNLMEVRNAACEKLLAARVEQKLKGTKVNDVLNKIHLAVPMVPRDGVDRSPFIPEAVKSMKKYDPNDPERRKLSRDVEAENGGAGVYNINLRDKYMLEKDEWKNDIIPELLDGKNVYDFLDPEIGSKLQALEEEEERLEAEGFYDSEDDDIFETEEDADIRMKAAWIREKKKLIQNENRSRKSLRNRAIIPRSKVRKTLSQMEAHLDSIHVDHTEVTERARGRAAEEKAYEASIDEGGVDTIMREAARSRSRGPAESTANEIQSSRFDAGLGTKSLRAKADRIEKMHRRERNRLGRAGEADRHVADTKPKHLFAGKRGIGKTSRR